MADERNMEQEAQELQEQELDLEALDLVSGGSLRDVKKVKTTDISSNTIGKI